MTSCLNWARFGLFGRQPCLYPYTTGGFEAEYTLERGDRGVVGDLVSKPSSLFLGIGYEQQIFGQCFNNKEITSARKNITQYITLVYLAL